MKNNTFLGQTRTEYPNCISKSVPSSAKGVPHQSIDPQDSSIHISTSRSDCAKAKCVKLTRQIAKRQEMINFYRHELRRREVRNKNQLEGLCRDRQAQIQNLQATIIEHKRRNRMAADILAEHQRNNQFPLGSLSRSSETMLLGSETSSMFRYNQSPANT